MKSPSPPPPSPPRQIEWCESEQKWAYRIGGKGNPILYADEKWNLEEFLDRLDTFEKMNRPIME